MDPFPRKKEPGSFFQTPSIHFPTILDKLQHACIASTVPGGSRGPGRPVTVLSRGSKKSLDKTSRGFRMHCWVIAGPASAPYYMRDSDFARLKRNMMDLISRMTDSVNWNGLCDVYSVCKVHLPQKSTSTVNL